MPIHLSKICKTLHNRRHSPAKVTKSLQKHHKSVVLLVAFIMGSAECKMQRL